MHPALLIATGFILQADNAEAFYKFKVGTEWNLEATKKGAAGLTKLKLKVLKEDSGKVQLEWKAYRKQDEADTESVRWYVSDGILTWVEMKGDSEERPIQLYKVGSKKGDSWDWKVGEDCKAKATHMGLEEVTVAAGTYKNALRVRWEKHYGERTTKFEGYLVPGVGPVKMVSGPDNDQTVLELKEFKTQK